MVLCCSLYILFYFSMFDQCHDFSLVVFYGFSCTCEATCMLLNLLKASTEIKFPNIINYKCRNVIMCQYHTSLGAHAIIT